MRKRHPLFAKCQAQVSLLGEGKSLVFLGNLGTDSVRHQAPLDCHLRIPAGWWWTAISTQPSVTLHHTYWSFENRHCENHWDPPFFTSRKKKKKHTRPAVGYTWWIYGYDESYVGEICSRWVYYPSICPPYISNSGNPFLAASRGWALWKHCGLPLNHNKLPSMRLVQQNGGADHEGWKMLCNSLTQQVDVINVMSLGTEWQGCIVDSDDVLWITCPVRTKPKSRHVLPRPYSHSTLAFSFSR